MSTCLPPTSMYHQRYCGVSQNFAAAAASPSHFISVARSTVSFTHFYSKINLIHASLFPSYCSFPPFPCNPRAWSGRCHARSPGPPPPPKLEPPSGETKGPSSGTLSNFSQVQEAVRIFFAVLFWMSLFFWSCVWDGSNSGRPGKGSRFRR